VLIVDKYLNSINSERQVPIFLDNLSKEIQQLNSVLEELHGQLRPVLAAGSLKPMTEPKIEISELVPLAQDLQGKIVEIRAIREKVMVIIERLEL